MLKSLYIALEDMTAGLRMHEVWTALAHEDISDQHRRTTLGPVWLLINYLLFAGTFIFIFHRSANSDYVAHVAIGLFVWFYIMEVVNGAVTLFVREEGFIKGTKLPFSVYAFRMSMQSIIRASYALAGCFGILFLVREPMTIYWFWSILALVYIVAITPFVIMFFATVGAYFPDSQYIVSNLMRVGMFATPVFWQYSPGEGGVRAAFYHWDPFTYFLEIVRAPVIAGEIPWHAWIACLVLGVGVSVMSLVLFGSNRKNLVFVL